MIAPTTQKTRIAKFPHIAADLYTADDVRRVERAAYDAGLNASQPKFENGLAFGFLSGMAFAGTLLAFFSL